MKIMKQIIINKTKELLRFMVYILLPLAGGGWMGVSCVDTVILPDNKTVDEDYWQKKSEVDVFSAISVTAAEVWVTTTTSLLT